MRYYLILLAFFLIGQPIYSQNKDNSNDTTSTHYSSMDYNIGDHPNSKTPIANSLPLKCEIYRIQEVEKAYIIDVMADSGKFKYTIISLKTEKQNLKKIKRGQQYELVLFAYYPYTIIGHNVFYIEYTVDGVRVGFKGDLKTGEIVTTPNLQGLYYLKPE